MRCPIETPETAEVLLAYGAGKLDAESRAALAQHMEVCDACREFARGHHAVWKALDAWEVPAVSADFNRRLYQRIDQEVSWWDALLRPFRPLFVRQGLPVAAAVALVVGAGALIMHPGGGPIPPAPVSAEFDVVAPDQAEHALQEMEMMREFNRLIHTDTTDPKM